MGPAGGRAAARTTDASSAPVERTGVLRWLRHNLMLVVTLTGVLLGIALGLGLRPLRLGTDAVLLISYPGELFMRVLKLMILPLIISSLVAGSASLNAKMSGKIAVRTLLYFVLTSMFNVLLGLLLVLAIHPGNPGLKTNFNAAVQDGRDVNIMDSLLDLGRNIFPDNLFQAAFQQAHTVYQPLVAPGTIRNLTEDDMVRVIKYRSGTNTLGIVFFCLVFGTLLGTLGSKGQVVIDFFEVIFQVVMRMVSGVMWFTPVGVSSIIAGKILGVDDIGLVMSQLAWFIVTVALGVSFTHFVVNQLIYFLFLRKNPFKFYWGLIEATLTAMATASAAAALPVTLRCMEEKVRVDKRVTRFVLPIGTNVNMDGTALFLAVSSVFIAQMNNIQLGFGELVTIFLTSTVASFSSASVPSAALVLLLVVLATVDAPAQDVSLLFAVDWFVDRMRTPNNMLGDCYAAAVVEHLSKKELMACDAATLEPEINGHSATPQTEEGHITPDDKTSMATDDVIIEMHLQAQAKKVGNGIKTL